MRYADDGIVGLRFYGQRLFFNKLTNNTVSLTYGTSISGTYSGDVIIPSEIEVEGTTYSVVEIGKWAFDECTDLTSVVIPASVKKIKYLSFYGCTKLSFVTLGESVSKVGSAAFKGCSSMKQIRLLCTVPPQCGTSVFEGFSKSQTILYVPEGSIEAYASASEWKTFDCIL